MKTTFSTFLVVLATVLAIGCAKNDGGGGGGNNFQNPSNPCNPDQFGNVASGCNPNNPIPGFNGLYGSMSPTNPSDDDNNSIVRLIQNVPMYPVFRSPPLGFGGYMSNGFFVVTGGLTTTYRSQCGTGGFFSGDVCTNECKNFRSRLSLFLTTSGNTGTLQILAAYRAPGGCNAIENGLERVADVRVQVYPTGGISNPGFTLMSINAYPMFGKNIQIDFPNGSLTVPGTYTGTMYLNGESYPLGTVTLTRR